MEIEGTALGHNIAFANLHLNLYDAVVNYGFPRFGSCHAETCPCNSEINKISYGEKYILFLLCITVKTRIFAISCYQLLQMI
jgi:hypothetical protein